MSDTADQPNDDPAWLAEARAMHGLPPLDPSEAPQPPDASDPKQAETARRKQRMAERARKVTIHEMMMLREVRAVIYHWLERTGEFDATLFPAGAFDRPSLLAFNAGKHDIGQAMKNDLWQCSPKEFELMITENAPD